MTDNDFRAAWLAMQARIDTLEQQVNDRNSELTNLNRRNSLENLADRYKRFAILSLAMVLCSAGLFNTLFPDESFRFIPFIMMAYFLIASIMDWYLMFGIKSIDVNTMSVNQVCSLVKYYKKRHHQFMIVLIPICVVILSLFVCAFASNHYTLAGVICGAIVGLAIGIRQYHKFMADYKTIENQ